MGRLAGSESGSSITQEGALLLRRIQTALVKAKENTISKASIVTFVTTPIKVEFENCAGYSFFVMLYKFVSKKKKKSPVLARDIYATDN